MPTRIYSARPALAEPGGFLRDALLDLVMALPMAAMLFRAGLRSRHRRAGLSYIWLIVPGAATALTFTLIQHSHILAYGDKRVPYGIFVLTGMFLWQGASEALAMPLAQLTARRRFLFQTPLPHEAVLLAGLAEIGLNMAVRLALLALVLVIWGMPVRIEWALVPGAALLCILLGLAAGIWLAPWGLLFDDVGQGIRLFTSFGLLLTPVVYAIPAGSVLRYNPLAPPLDAARGWVAGYQPTAGFGQLALLAVGGLGVAWLGWLHYRLARPHLATRVC